MSKALLGLGSLLGGKSMAESGRKVDRQDGKDAGDECSLPSDAALPFETLAKLEDG
jgi:hypothetical protein